jgi:hypothetical protein
LCQFSTLSPPPPFIGKAAATVLCFTAAAVDSLSHRLLFLVRKSKTTAAPRGSSLTHQTRTFFTDELHRRCSVLAIVAHRRPLISPLLFHRAQVP